MELALPNVKAQEEATLRLASERGVELARMAWGGASARLREQPELPILREAAAIEALEEYVLDNARGVPPERGARMVADSVASLKSALVAFTGTNTGDANGS